MSKSYKLVFSEQGKLIPNKDTLDYLKSIEEKIILIGLISSTHEGHSYLDSFKYSLLSNIINSHELIPNPLPQSIFLYPTKLVKENFNSKIFVIDINASNNKHIFSLCFLICSLFVFCFDENINEKELNKYNLINSLIETLNFKNKTDAQKINFFSESSPKLICYIPNSKSSFSDFYLEESLSQEKTYNEINLLKNNISKIFKNKELFWENDENNQNLIEKILEKVNPKELNGKYFDGNSIAFFIENFCEMHNDKTNPKFDLLFGNLIYNDLQVFKNKSLKYFEDNINKLEIDNEENLISKIYDIKLKSMEIYNSAKSLNFKVFNKLEYMEYNASFNTIKKDLEKKFKELENKKIIENLNKSELICNELLNKHFDTINKKIMNEEYNKDNTDEFMNDYKSFLDSYEKEAKGNNKIKCLINFLIIHKPQYFNCLLYNNQNILKKDTFDNEENIEEIKIKLNRKKRSIDNLKKDIKKIEDDIKKIQTLENDISSKKYESIQ